MAATLADVAKAVGVTPSTVADILRGRPGYAQKTRLKTLDAARKLQFVPNHFARSLMQQKSQTIGVAGRLDSTIVNGRMLKAITDALLQKGYMPLFCDCSSADDGTERALRELRSRSVDGIILSAGVSDELVNAALPKDFPYVVVQNMETKLNQCVIADRHGAIFSGVQWLAQRGHKRIAFLGTDQAYVMQQPGNSSRLKIEGYLRGMQQQGLTEFARVIDTNSSAGEIYDYVRTHGDIFRSLTAVIAGNDRVALEVIGGLMELGLRVPDDCSIIGFDDTDFAKAIRPHLTTFNPRREEVGAKAVDMLMDLIEGKPVNNITIVPRLVERESVRSI